MFSRLPARAKRKCIIFINFQWRREAKMAIFKHSSILKNSSALGSFNCIFENNSLKASFGQNMKKLKILKLSPDSRYLQKLALNDKLECKEMISLYNLVTFRTFLHHHIKIVIAHVHKEKRFLLTLQVW